MAQADVHHAPLTPDEIYARLRQIAEEELTLAPGIAEGMQPSTPIVQGLQLDSLAQVTLSAAIEDQFGVVLEPEDQQTIVTVQDLAELIHDRMESNRSS